LFRLILSLTAIEDMNRRCIYEFEKIESELKRFYNWEIDSSALNMGSYNFSNPSNWFSHIVNDVVPYGILGNTSDDTNRGVIQVVLAGANGIKFESNRVAQRIHEHYRIEMS
jgi:hypothetical protein